MHSTVLESRAATIANEPLVSVTPSSGLFRGFGASMRDIWRNRELLVLLVRRELKARYKDSTLGVAWSLLRPLAQLAIYYIAIGQILGTARSVPDFAVFVFTGLTMWGLFNEIVSTSTSSILANAGLVKKVYLPREIFPLSSAGGALFNFGVQLVVLAIAIIFLSTSPPSSDWWIAPIAVLVLLVFSLAVGLVLGALNVYFRDTQHFVEVAMIILFWASPIVYSFTYVHNALQGNWLEQIYLGNPVTIAVIGMQRALWGAGSAEGSTQVWPDDLELRLVITLAVSLVLLWLAQRLFARMQGNFAQEL